MRADFIEESKVKANQYKATISQRPSPDNPVKSCPTVCSYLLCCAVVVFFISSPIWQNSTWTFQIDIFAYLGGVLWNLFMVKIYLFVFGLYHQLYRKKQNNIAKIFWFLQSSEKFTKWFMSWSAGYIYIIKLNITICMHVLNILFSFKNSHVSCEVGITRPIFIALAML